MAVVGIIIGMAVMLVLVKKRRQPTKSKHLSPDRWESHVFPHGPLVELVPNRVWQVTGSLKHQSLPRNMVIYRMNDKNLDVEKPELWVHSVIALNDDTMRQLEKLGTPTVLVVPNGMHRSDCGVWKQRFPNIQLICPEAAREAVERVVHVDSTCEKEAEELNTRGVVCHQPEGVRPGEIVFQLKLDDGGSALVFTDLFFNLPHGAGFFGWLFRMLGSTGFFGMTGIGRMFMLKNKAVFKNWVLQRLATIPDVRVISVAHGNEISHDTNARLRDAAARLG